MSEIEFIEQSSPAYGPPAPVPIIQEENEFTPLLKMYRKRAPKRVLEIGTYMGGTLFHWLQNATAGALVVAVDDGHPNNTMYSDWCASGVSYQVVRGDTRDPEVIEQVRQYAPFDWCFIDAGHMDEEVRADWANYSPMLTGVVAFHDIIEHEGLPRIQVFHLWAELKEKYDTLEIDYGGSGIGVVYLP